MERVVIAAYEPFPGQEPALAELMKTHWERLNKESLVSSRKPMIVRTKDGSIIEVFGWKSQEAILAAHLNATVLRMWEEFSEVCEYVPVNEIQESQQLFSKFTPVN